MKTKTFTLFLALAASVGTLFAESGTCGANLTWDLTDGTLTISGTGAMRNWDNNSTAPWYKYRENIMSVTIGNGVTCIGDCAFYDCSGLTSVTIPNSVTSIRDEAFAWCESLTSVTIPNRVTSIGEWAFAGCSALTSVTIPNSVTSIGAAFCYCEGLTEIKVEKDNPNYCSVDGVLFNKTKTMLVQYLYEKKGPYTIPNSVTSIGSYAFCGCSGLTGVTIPNSVTGIEDWAFYDCSGLTSVTIPNSVTIIGEGAFLECSGLTEIKVEKDNPNYCSLDGVVFNKTKTTLVLYPSGKQGFYTIPNSVTRIGEMAFSSCKGLTSITCKANVPPTCGSSAFDGVDKSIPLYVLAGRVDAYKTANQWKDFTNVLPIQQAEESTVTEILAGPTDNSVVIEWPAVTGATVYTIEIRKNGELICTLSFNEQGQLLSISFEKKAANGTPKTAAQTATGWQYTIGGLDAGTTYQYIVIAKNGEKELFNKAKIFTTTGIATAIENQMVNGKCVNGKFLKDGHLLILRDGKTYNVNGVMVE